MLHQCKPQYPLKANATCQCPTVCASQTWLILSAHINHPQGLRPSPHCSLLVCSRTTGCMNFFSLTPERNSCSAWRWGSIIFYVLVVALVIVKYRETVSVRIYVFYLCVTEDHWSDLFWWRSGAIGGGHASWHLFPLPGPAPYGEAKGGDVAVTKKETLKNPLRDRKGSCTISNQTAAALLSYSKHSSFIWKYSINDQTSKSKSKSKWSGWQDIMLRIKYVNVSKSSIYLCSYIFWNQKAVGVWWKPQL